MAFLIGSGFATGQEISAVLRLLWILGFVWNWRDRVGLDQFCLNTILGRWAWVKFEKPSQILNILLEIFGKVL